MNNMNCMQCGKRLSDEARFCDVCGAPVGFFNPVAPRPYDPDNPQGQAAGVVPYGYGGSHSGGHNATQQKNTQAILGFIFAFIIPIVGLVLSIIGLNKSKTNGGVGRGMAIAGIVISIAVWGITMIMYANNPDLVPFAF